MQDPTDKIGSGNPYYGSGFLNFDRYLNEQNLDWGGRQAEYVPQGEDFSQQPNLDNWIIDVARARGYGAQPDWMQWQPSTPPATPEQPESNSQRPPWEPEPIDWRDQQLPRGYLEDRGKGDLPKYPNPPNYSAPNPNYTKPSGEVPEGENPGDFNRSRYPRLSGYLGEVW